MWQAHSLSKQWRKENGSSKENSTQEVDFVVQRDVDITAIEVKAEENLTSKSLKAFHADNPSIRCIRSSMSDYRKEEWMENVPLYAIRHAL